MQNIYHAHKVLIVYVRKGNHMHVTFLISREYLSWLFRPLISKANTARLPRCSTNTERCQAANRPSQTHRRPAAVLHRQVIRRRPLAGPANRSSYARSSVPEQGGNSVLLGLVVWSIETNSPAPVSLLSFSICSNFVDREG
jgi:hypothetical protein